MADTWACLQCGAELEHDWMPCPHCGWQAPGPWDDASAEPESGTPTAQFKAFSRPRKPWIRAVAFLVFVAFLLLVLGWWWHKR